MRNKKLLPMILIQLYLFITLILFVIGPWDFKVNNMVNLILLLFIYQVFLLYGYFIGINGIKVGRNVSFNCEKSNIKLFKKLMIFYTFVLLIEVTRSLGLTSISISQIIEKFIIGIKNPQSGYLSKLEVNNSNVFLGSIGTIIMFIASPISYAMMPLIIYYFKQLDKKYKILASFIICLNLTKYIATGTNKGIFDFVIIYISYILLKYLKNKTSTINKNKIKMFTIIIVLCSILFTTFSHMIGSRAFGTYLNSGSKLASTVSIDDDSILMSLTPTILKKPVILLSSYLCQGYYGLSLSMEVESTPMLGFGNSIFLVDQISEKYDINKYTLQKKVENKYGWNSRVQWFSMYSWIANDVGFIGVSLYMFLLGLFFALVYKDSIVNDNIIAKVLFSFLLIQFIFIPANNQLMLTMNSTISTIFFTILWFISKKIKVKKNQDI
ncbi:hypothetical protein J0L31_09090 [Terrisporobacter glycolicus]|nr:hypothetical protein [Terrisporobacter glycolicus]